MDKAKNIAICIGINSYDKMPKLEYAKRDAEEISKFFRDQAGFDFVYFFGDYAPKIDAPDFDQPIKATPSRENLEWFLYHRFKDPFLDDGDNLWFFFSGHGLRDAGQDYLMPFDADPTPGRVARSAITVDDITRRLRRSGADNIIVVLDACRNEGSGKGASIGRQEQTGMITITACSPRETAHEIKDLKHGAFTYAFLKWLRGKNGATVKNLSHVLRQEVPKINRRYNKPRQMPCVIVEPNYKSSFILLPDKVKPEDIKEDIRELKYEALKAENKGDRKLAKQLWIRVNSATDGNDMEAIEAFMRLGTKKLSSPDNGGTVITSPKGPGSSQSQKNNPKPPPILSSNSSSKSPQPGIKDGRLTAREKFYLQKNSGRTGTVKKLFGGGVNTKVYEVEVGGNPMAVKWFSPQKIQQDPNLEQRLKRLIDSQSPSDNFCWPLDLVKVPGKKSYGYLMKLKEERFKSIKALVNREIHPSFKALVTAGFNLVDSYRELHFKGLCYSDISFNHIYFDPVTGEIRISDNDCANRPNLSLSLKGQARFMAPEIVRGEASPSTQTDLYSLAVLLFYLFFAHHPLEGAKYEAMGHLVASEKQRKIYGTEPVFIFDRHNNSNRPLPGVHSNPMLYKNIYPKFLKDLFEQAFTKGIQDPAHGRVQGNQWKKALTKLRDYIFYCSHCQAENFYDVNLLKQQGRLNPCWNCGRVIQIPPRIRIGTRVIMLNHDTKLYPHHIDKKKQYNFQIPVAAVIQNPYNPSIWGLRNLSNEPWTMAIEDNQMREVEPGRSVTINRNTKINFGTEQGEIRI